jgi:hypothetical protein
MHACGHDGHSAIRYPPMVSEPAQAELCARIAADIFGARNVTYQSARSWLGGLLLHAEREAGML